ncbi:MAG: hypothetical protein LH472_16970 [Pyrinomonadaceae bacterium]|nr:hypothetical protein [Pyrinomonadaceae bacterium]
MKTLFLTAILTFIFGSVIAANAQKPDQPIKVRVGKEKKFSRSKINVKFVALIEDSRCPEGVNCVWAGNAKIKVQISEGSNAGETFEINTNLGPKGATFGGYAVNLISLTPTPKDNVRINKNSYTATFSIARLTR